MAPLVQLSSVRRHFRTMEGADHVAVQDVSFAVQSGETVCIVGKTGCGKSTLVNMLLGVLRPSAGRIQIDGIAPSEDFMGLRHKIAAVFQTDRLLPWRNVVDNAAIGLEIHGVDGTTRRARAMEWLEKVGLHRWSKAYPHQLSGGMRQRVSIARAFVLDPVVLLLDEAFGHLDEVTAHDLREDCLGLISETGKAVIMVTHNISEALEVGDRLIVLGRPAQVLDKYELAALRCAPGWEARKSDLRQDIFRLIETRSSELAMTVN